MGVKEIIHTLNAPAPSGAYSQGVLIKDTLYLAGQIGKLPSTQQLIQNDFTKEAHQVFKNLQAVCQAAKANLSDIVKLTIYLTDLQNFAIVNQIMAQYFVEPYPARTTVQVAGLPANANVEIEGIAVIG